MPNGRRNNAPVRTGVAVSRPNSVASRPSFSRIGIAVTPNIIHTAKQIVKAQVVISRTERFPDFAIRASDAAVGSESIILTTPRGRVERTRSPRPDRRQLLRRGGGASRGGHDLDHDGSRRRR
jgi:hypothetical protein